ncbi:hypothetical protein TSAR_010542 [Trichomalopsis sarcophagae]|uniref:carbonic anhydrase n=1 Tax=Trichomalopsis sarcophagae TaxID=543379 RepID=A0A232F4S8_9HYME|nr:hypothetical protein TSAR_010542 [Trichomalopsis sarcophagae]
MIHPETYRPSAVSNLLAISPLVLLVLLSYGAPTDAAAKGHIDFGYSGPHGPAHWAEDYDTCFGKHQSPINILEHEVRDTNLPPLLFSGLDLPRKVYLVNNGHTALLHASNDSEKAYMSGGPLNGTYVFEQLHFHWGENDREGSEDLINNHSFAMELHAVFYKDDYGSMNGAVAYRDGLAVLAFFFEAEADNKANPMFDDLVEALPKIEKVGSEIRLKDSLRLENLLDPAGPPDDRMQNYFTYNGSLTTPPCSEVVTWIDFKHPLFLSHAQIAAFRDISSSEGQKLTHNFRPVQPLADRLVLHNSPKRLTGEISEKTNEILADEKQPSSASSPEYAALACVFFILSAYNAR